MPRASVLATTPRYAGIREMFALKHRWGTSIASVVRRLRDLELLNDAEYQAACIAVSSRGWRTEEPEPISARETSLVLHKIIELMREDGKSVGDFARALSMKVEDVSLLLQHLVIRIASETSDGATTPSTQVRPEMRLRLVHSR